MECFIIALCMIIFKSTIWTFFLVLLTRVGINFIPEISDFSVWYQNKYWCKVIHLFLWIAYWVGVIKIFIKEIK